MAHQLLYLCVVTLVTHTLAQYGGVPQPSHTKRTTTTFAPDVIPSDQQAQKFYDQHQTPSLEQTFFQQQRPIQRPYEEPAQKPYEEPAQTPYKENTVYPSSGLTDNGPPANANSLWWVKDSTFLGANPVNPAQSCTGTQCGGPPPPAPAHIPQPSGVSPGNPFINKPQQGGNAPCGGYGGCGGNEGSTVACTSPGHVCVSKHHCSGGVVQGSADYKAGIQKCDSATQACCRLPSNGQVPNVRPNPPVKYPSYQGQGTAPGTNGVPIGGSIYDTQPRPTYKPYTGPLNTTPYPGCAAALKCVELIYCTAEGVMVDTPQYLTRDQEENRVPLSECSNPDTGILGKCCRDPNYKDPWPGGMMMPNMPGQFDQAGFQTGQYFEQRNPSQQHQLNQQGSVNQGPLITHQQPQQQVPRPQQQVPQQQKPYQPPQQPYQPPQQPYQPPQQIPQPQQPYQPPQQPYQPPQQIPQPQKPYQPPQQIPQPQKPYQPPQQIPQPQKPYQPPQQIPQPQKPYQPPQQIPQPQKPYQPPQQIPQPQKPYQPPQQIPQPQKPYQPPQQQPYQPPQEPYQPEPSPPQNNYPAIQPPRPPTGIVPGAKCGLKRPANRNGLSDVEAGFGEYPWHVLVVKTGTNKPLCSGALISDKAVVTAAHCVQDLDSGDLHVQAGVWKLNARDNPRPPQSSPVAALARHPQHDEGTLAHDMAVLLLSAPLQLEEHVDTLCIPRGQPSQQGCVVTGYGKQALQANAPGSSLHQVVVNFIPNNVCEQKLRATNLGKYFVLNQSFQCALPSNPGQDMCKVGPGSPIACDRGDGQHELSALYSWNVGCNDASNPTAVASVDTAWINNILESPLQDIIKVEQNEIERKKKSQEVVDQETKPGFSQGYGK